MKPPEENFSWSKKFKAWKFFVAIHSYHVPSRNCDNIELPGTKAAFLDHCSEVGELHEPKQHSLPISVLELNLNHGLAKNSSIKQLNFVMFIAGITAEYLQ